MNDPALPDGDTPTPDQPQSRGVTLTDFLDSLGRRAFRRSRGIPDFGGGNAPDAADKTDGHTADP